MVCEIVEVVTLVTVLVLVEVVAGGVFVALGVLVE